MKLNKFAISYLKLKNSEQNNLVFSRSINFSKKPNFTYFWQKHRPILLGTILFLAVLGIYRQTAWFDFVLFDDPGYVVKNPLVNGGLSWDTFCGIWTNFTVSNWHPLTMFSHQLDVSVFDLNAGGHHLTNVLLHAINALLFFLVIMSYTGTMWRAFFVALLFAIHPLHVESVAWVSERKDLLSTLFGLMTLLAYRKYTEKSEVKQMAYVTILFALCLMSKPMLVTLPFLMLLLDWWPLDRFKSDKSKLNANSWENWKRRIYVIWRLSFEKWPLFLLSVGSCVITLLAQSTTGAVVSLGQMPFIERFYNSLTALFIYLNKMLWPSALGVFYPLPSSGHSTMIVLLSAGVISSFSILAISFAFRRPWWFTGWFWYLGTLVPVLGLVQVGSQSWADRYTYWPLAGIFIIISWECESFWKIMPSSKIKKLCMVLILTALSALGFTAWIQTHYWKNTELLFKHTIEVVPNNWLAHSILGIAVTKEGRLDEALEHYRAAYLMGPRNGPACNNMGKIHGLRGDTELSLEWHLRATAVEPKSPMGYYCAANALAILGRKPEAEAAYLKALSLDPYYSDALFNYANLLRDSGHTNEAEACYRRLLSFKPNYVNARLNLSALLADNGNYAASVHEYELILKMEPNNPLALNNLGISLIHMGRPEKAVPILARAVHVQPDNADTHFCFALAKALSGDKEGSIAELNTTLQINPSHVSGNKLLNELKQLQP